jgi:hypothetical protein
MPKVSLDNRGVVLLVVVATIMIAVVLAGVVLKVVSSQARLSHHDVSRVQAYYASIAGVNYAFEQLRKGAAGGGWVVGANCIASSPCEKKFDDGDFYPPVLINPINGVSIIIRPAQSSNSAAPCYNPPGGNACISVNATYTSTP